MSRIRRNSDSDSICSDTEAVTSNSMGKIRTVKAPKCRLKFIMFVLCVSVVIMSFGFLMLFLAPAEEVEEEFDVEEKHYSVYGDFLINNPNCKIPNLNPFAEEVMKIFKRVKHEPCSDKQPLTSIVQNFETDEAFLMIHDENESQYLTWWQKNLECCYQTITRSGEGKDADNEFKLSKCTDFNNRHSLKPSEDLILVTCSGKTLLISASVYKNGHATIRSKKNVEEKLKKRKENLKENSKEKLTENQERTQENSQEYQSKNHQKQNSNQKENLKESRENLKENRENLNENQENSGKLHKNSSKENLNVFMLGIDAVSRLNLVRALPETYKHLHRNDDWFELRGYNKIGDNTLPNLLAIFTGMFEDEVLKKCNWNKVGGIEKCRFIWNDFSDAGYTTAYAEDETSINTFNYHKPGFVKQPTDYFLRPFNLAIEENLETRVVNKRRICVGCQHYADFIYNYGFDFANKFVNDSFFGVFWTNSFSHEDLSMVSAMDGQVKSYLEQLETRGILDSSIVIFFSDHGMRFGPIRNLFIGWVEERLPFFYMWLPPKFRDSHPEFVKALRTNRDRLSSPYDVHVTLKHILKLSGGFSGELSASSCPDCQSLFTELPVDRSCADAGVDRHWCTCVEFKIINETSKIVQTAVKQIIKEVNKDLAPHPKCAVLKLQKISSARMSPYRNSTDYLISFNVHPSDAQLEATIRCDDGECEDYKIIGTVSRLNRYGDQSICVNDAHLRKYCYCT